MFFIAVQVLHLPLVLSLPFSKYLTAITTSQTAVLAITAIVLGLLAGLFEEIGRYLVFKRFFPWKNISLSKKNALLFGAGWGGVESALIGVIVMITMFSYISAVSLTEQSLQATDEGLGGNLTPEQVEVLKELNKALMNITPFSILLGLFERLAAFPMHIAWTLLVLSAVVYGRNTLLLLAIAWHAIVDASAVFIAGTYGALAAEVAILPFALLALWYIFKQWPKAESDL
jgi:uncharacterized membrane protein YhfC